MSLSGIFRDLLPLQTRVLAEAAYLAASADEALSMNFIRRNTLAYQAKEGCDFDTACLRVFSNADGAYGAHINHLIERAIGKRKMSSLDYLLGEKALPMIVEARPRSSLRCSSATCRK
jgi:hypothetical protein